MLYWTKECGFIYLLHYLQMLDMTVCFIYSFLFIMCLVRKKGWAHDFLLPSVTGGFAVVNVPFKRLQFNKYRKSMSVVTILERHYSKGVKLDLVITMVFRELDTTKVAIGRKANVSTVRK